ncbi:hypothetical protein ACFYMC_22890 [Streptomyces sp. NPDC006879]
MNDPEGSAPRTPDPAQDTDYSATALASHWIEHGTAVSCAPVPPDGAEGPVLRFGPGVTAHTARTTGPYATSSAGPAWPGATTAPRRRPPFAALRQYALAASVLLAVLVYLGWKHLAPEVEVGQISVSAPGDPVGCGATAGLTAVLRTNGRPGTLVYRWVRNDGSRSPLLSERVASGQREARLRLFWSFRGEGVYRARAEIQLLSPARRTATAAFRYRCADPTAPPEGGAAGADGRG